MSPGSDRNQRIIDEFRANEGRVGGVFAGRTLLLLHTIGAKTHEERVNPTAYVRDGKRFVIVASKGGADSNPGWYHNLVAHPRVTIEVGTATLRARASIAQEPERTRLYNKMVEMMPSFGEYPGRTKRIIPVIVLSPED